MRELAHANYPNHPLFRIAPLLDRGFQTVNFDPYERVLVAKIKAGRYTSDLWDCNGLYLNYDDRVGSHVVNRPAIAVKSRYTMTPEERRAWANSYGDPLLDAERERRRAQRAEAAAERRRWEQEVAEKQARRQAQQEERAREWARVEDDTEQYRSERARIMDGPWECTSCLTPSKISIEPAGCYAISCRTCGRRAVGDHATLLKVLNTLALNLSAPANVA